MSDAAVAPAWRERFPFTERILTWPDPRLRRLAGPVRVFDEALREAMDALEAWMRRPPGGVGIAAPQLGVPLRMVIVDCRGSRRPCANHGLLRMVNPVIESAEGEQLGREGCLSVPDWTGMVARAARVTVRWQDETGAEHRLSAKGFEARAIQHEIDHLDGVLFIDRVVNTRDLVRRPRD